MSEYDFTEALREYVEEQVRRNNDAIETMCERMLTQDGTDFGVLVVTNGDGTVTTSLSPEVPFGQIHMMTAPATGYEWGIGPYHQGGK